jgi:hypothetical protein
LFVVVSIFNCHFFIAKFLLLLLFCLFRFCCRYLSPGHENVGQGRPEALDANDGANHPATLYACEVTFFFPFDFTIHFFFELFYSCIDLFLPLASPQHQMKFRVKSLLSTTDEECVFVVSLLLSTTKRRQQFGASVTASSAVSASNSTMSTSSSTLLVGANPYVTTNASNMNNLNLGSNSGSLSSTTTATSTNATASSLTPLTSESAMPWLSVLKEFL